jgi:Fur family ferric uptake transcriptional regulator
MDTQITQTNYKTKQKSLIYECVVETEGKHFTAEDIVEMLDSRGSHVGKTTVYRQLDRMLAEGEIRKYMLGDKIGACYQYTGKKVCEHFHLKCIECGKLIHADCAFLEKLKEHISEEHDFFIDGSRTVFYGTCRECRKKGLGKVPFFPHLDDCR